MGELRSRRVVGGARSMSLFLSLRGADQQPVENTSDDDQIAWAGNHRFAAAHPEHKPVGQQAEWAGLDDDILRADQHRAWYDRLAERGNSIGVYGHRAAVERHR